MDQLNPAGFNVFNVPYKEDSHFIPAQEIGNLETKNNFMAELINWIKLSSRRTDQTTENNLQEIAACLFSQKRRSNFKGI